MTRLNVAFHRALDINADPVSGGQMYVFRAGTTTPVTTYSDPSTTIVQPHPVIADAAGLFPDIYALDGSYKVRIADDLGAVLYEADFVSTGGAGGLDGAYSTLDLLMGDAEVKVGDTVETLGYSSFGDNGGGSYNVVAADTGVADGGSYIDLAASGLQAELQHGGDIRAEQWGVVLDATGKAQERSTQFNLAFAYAASALADTYVDAPEQKIETDGIDFICETDFLTSEILILLKQNGSRAENLRVQWSGRVIAILGGALEADTALKPIPVVNGRMKNCQVQWPRFEAEMVCSGIKLDYDAGCVHSGLDMRGFTNYGLWPVKGNDSVWHDFIIKQFYRDPLWVRNGVDPTDFDNWTGDCIISSTKDRQFRGGQIGWSGPAVRLLDTMPNAAAERIPGQNCYWCGLSAAKGFVDGDNGGGDVMFSNLHMMQVINDNFLPISGSRYGAYKDYDLATGGIVIRRVDSTIGILSFCKVSNLSYFDRLDNDNCVHYLFGSQVEITNEATESTPWPKTKSTDPDLRLEPRIRNFASRGPNGLQRWPFMASMHHQMLATMSFEDNPAEIYWDGAALIEARTSWSGDWDEWNRLNRASGRYSGQVQWQGLLATGTHTPAVTAAGDFWIAQGTITVNPGGVVATDGDLVYALIAAPAVAGDWLVVDEGSAPINATTRYETDVRSHHYVLYPEKNVVGVSNKTEVTGDVSLSHKMMIGTGEAVTKTFDGTVVNWEGASAYRFDSGIGVGGSGAILNAYEEDVWTPAMSDAISAGNLATITIESASYVKIGMMVFLKCKISAIDTAGLTAGNVLYIQGLPYPNSAGVLGPNNASVVPILQNFTFTGIPLLETINGSSSIKITDMVSGGVSTDLTVAAIASGTGVINLSIAYMTLN